LGEKAFFFGTKNELFGILTAPAKHSSGEPTPTIIMVNAGTVHRMGPHRMYVRMAREWASLGFPVFRIDISGIGDGVVEDGDPENRCYPRHAVENVQAAMKLLKDRFATNRFILVGLCSGADISFQTAIKDAAANSMVALVMMNPRTFLLHDLEKVENYHGARQYQQSMIKKEKWLKLLQGKVNVFHVIGQMAPKVLDIAKKKLSFGKSAGLEETANASGFNQNVPDLFAAITKRGVDALLVVTEHDPGIDYVDTHFGKEMRSLEKISNFRRATFKGTDHTFTSLHAQKVITATITEQLIKHLPSKTVPSVLRAQSRPTTAEKFQVS
jgi:hypothetical protein